MRWGYFTCLSGWPGKKPWAGQAPSIRFGQGFTRIGNRVEIRCIFRQERVPLICNTVGESVSRVCAPVYLLAAEARLAGVTPGISGAHPWWGQIDRSWYSWEGQRGGATAALGVW